MPDWLYRLLENEENQHLKNAPPGISDILCKLLEQVEEIETVYLCHPAVRYVGKIKANGKDEGHHFCGYHNIQMLFSYVHTTDMYGHELFNGGIPSIWEIQGVIEEAWGQGFNESGRAQTGGIKGTRKHIGTPEVCRISFNPMVLLDVLTASLNRCRSRKVRGEYTVNMLTGPSTIWLLENPLQSGQIPRHQRWRQGIQAIARFCGALFF